MYWFLSFTPAEISWGCTVKPRINYRQEISPNKSHKTSSVLYSSQVTHGMSCTALMQNYLYLPTLPLPEQCTNRSLQSQPPTAGPRPAQPYMAASLKGDSLHRASLQHNKLPQGSVPHHWDRLAGLTRPKGCLGKSRDSSHWRGKITARGHQGSATEGA